MNHRLYMEMALEEAKLAYDKGEVPIGAVLVHDGQVIAQAHNLRETGGDPTAHAEVVAIRQGAKQLGGWRLANTTLYVTIEPCSMCAGAIVNARIPNLVYGALDPKAGGVDSVFNITANPLLNHQVNVIGGVMEAECAQLMKDFFRARRNSK